MVIHPLTFPPSHPVPTLYLLLLSLTTTPTSNTATLSSFFSLVTGSRYLLSDDGDDPGFDEHEDDECPSKFVEALCPMDRDTLDSSGAIIPDITDRELNAILKQISYAKGNRITFILDCCHAGSVTRTLSPGVRTVPPLERVSLKDMLFTAGEAFRGLPGDRSMFAEDWVADTDSHVNCGSVQGKRGCKSATGKGNEGVGRCLHELAHQYSEVWCVRSGSDV